MSEDDFRLIPGLRYSPFVPQSLIDTLHKPNIASKSWPKIAQSQEPCAAVRKITAPEHPAYGEHGLFATRELEPSDFILFYIGLVHLNTEEDTDPESNYDLSLDRELGVSIDARHLGNEARYMNDYRGVRPEGPNAEFRDCWLRLDEDSVRFDKDDAVPTRRKWERMMGVFVLPVGKAGKNKGIRKDAEILVNYGRTFWSTRKA